MKDIGSSFEVELN